MTLPTSIVSRPRVDIPHHRIHSGEYFSATATAQNLPAGIPKKFMISPPATSPAIHMISIINITPGAIFEFFEGIITSNDGIRLNAFNQDRNDHLTAVGFAFEDPIIISEGTLIFSQIIGSTTKGGTGGTANRDEQEFDLKIGTNYLLKITPFANNTLLSIQMRAYRPSIT